MVELSLGLALAPNVAGLLRSKSFCASAASATASALAWSRACVTAAALCSAPYDVIKAKAAAGAEHRAAAVTHARDHANAEAVADAADAQKLLERSTLATCGASANPSDNSTIAALQIELAASVHY
jgi:hypothetical protein